MEVNKDNNQLRGEAVSSLLPYSREYWHVPGAKDTLRREVILSRFALLRGANEDVLGGGGVEFHEMEDDYEYSVDFVNRSFDEFEAETTSNERYDWAFLVPVRGEENQGNKYASEVTKFLPILDPKYGAGAMELQRTVANLAPSKIETYQGVDDSRGILIFTPAYFDPAHKTSTTAMREMLPAARKRVSEAARLARVRHGVGIAGLGAILPGITGRGSSIREPGLVTTTGHAGTVHLIHETVQEVAERLGDGPVIGMLGLGAIGSASLNVLRESDLDNSIRSYTLFDENQEAMFKSVMTETSSRRRVSISDSSYELLNSSDIIVTAITDTIDLTDLERKHGQKIDLTGKVIIDDSQPGCFKREQVEARGGHLVWVVGRDASESQFLKRVDGYAYGDESGLHGDDAVWGCEAEVGALALLKKPELAVKSSVNFELASKIGRVCREAGIVVASPLQSFARPVEF